MAKTYTVAFGAGDPRTYTGLNPTLLIFVNASSGSTLVAPTFSEALTGSGIYKFSYGTTTPISFLADAATTSPGAIGRYVTGQIDPSDRSDEYGTTIVAIGTTLIGYGTSTLAFGSTLIGYGTTTIALGTTAVALGTTTVAIGTSHIAQGVSILAFGVSTLAFGSTLTGFGTSLTASQVVITGQGTSITAQGVSLTAQGSTLFGFGVSTVAFGTSLIALGNTILATAGVGLSSNAFIGTTASLIGNLTVDPVDLFGYVKRIAELIQGRQLFTKGSGVLDMYDRTGATLLAERTVSNNASLVTKS